MLANATSLFPLLAEYFEDGFSLTIAVVLRESGTSSGCVTINRVCALAHDEY
jgi:hypothetical protein